MTGNWKKLSSKYVYENPWIKVREDQVIRPDGEPDIYGVVENTPGICIVAREDDGKIWMVRHYRYIFDDAFWELIDGGMEAGETPEQAAKRELQEEMGMRAAGWNFLGIFRPSDGSIDEVVHVFLATGLNKTARVSEEFDILDRKPFSIEEIEKMISGGEVSCGYVMSALYLYRLYLNS